MKLDIRELRSEVASVRSDLQGLDKSLRAAISQLERDLTRGLASNRIWMLLQSAAHPRRHGALIQVTVVRT